MSMESTSPERGMEPEERVIKSGESDIEQSRSTGMSETYLSTMIDRIQERINTLVEVIKEGGDRDEIAQEKAFILSQIREFPGKYRLESDPEAEERLMREYNEKLKTD